MTITFVNFAFFHIKYPFLAPPGGAFFMCLYHLLTRIFDCGQLAGTADTCSSIVPKKFYEKTNNAYPLHRLGEGAVYTAGTCCANNFSSLLYSSQPPAFDFGILYAANVYRGCRELWTVEKSLGSLPLCH